MNVAEYAATWLVEHPRPAESTNRQAGYGIRPFVRDFGHHELDDISFAEAREWALEHRAAAKYARALYTDARRDDLLRVNPFENLRLPTQHGRRFFTSLTEDEVDTLAHYAPTAHFGLAINVAAYTGLRKGELLGLERNDVDFAGLEIYVNRSLRPDGTIALPKTGRKRVVVVPPMTFAGAVIPEQERLFPWTHAQHRERWDKTREAAGFGGCFHELRHFCATWMLNRGVSLELVAHQLGHSSVEITRRYLHPDPADLRDQLREALG